MHCKPLLRSIWMNKSEDQKREINIETIAELWVNLVLVQIEVNRKVEEDKLSYKN